MFVSLFLRHSGCPTPVSGPEELDTKQSLQLAHTPGPLSCPPLPYTLPCMKALQDLGRDCLAGYYTYSSLWLYFLRLFLLGLSNKSYQKGKKQLSWVISVESCLL